MNVTLNRELLKRIETKLIRGLTICSNSSRQMRSILLEFPKRKMRKYWKLYETSALGLPPAVNDVNNCFRCHFFTKNDKPRPISVAVRSKMIKAKFLYVYKRKKGLSTIEIVFTGPDISIFINDALTACNRKLFYMAKQFCKTKEFKYFWIQDSGIFIRLKDRSKILRISSEAD